MASIDTKVFDAIVVGSGAAGSFAARRLTKAGLETIVLDAGPTLDPVSDFAAPDSGTRPGSVAERVRALFTGQPVQCRTAGYASYLRHFYVNDADNSYTTARGRPFYWIRGRQVGGRLHLWGRLCPRFSDLELKAGSHDGAGEDWPISYSDLAPHYDAVEQCIGLDGHVDALPQLPDGCYQGTRALTAAELQFRAAVERRWPERRVLMARLAHEHMHPKPRALLDAETTGRLTLRHNAVVRKILADPRSGKATGVEYADRQNMRSHSISGRIVFLCASAFESVRLLMNSRGRRHPDGIGGSSGVLGRYIMEHLFYLTQGSVPPDIEVDTHSSRDAYDFCFGHGFYLPKFRNLSDRHPDFLRGYGICGGVGRGGHHWWMAMFGEMLPRARNQIQLSTRKQDAWGVPCAHIDLEPTANDLAMLKDAQESIEAMRLEAGLGPRKPRFKWRPEELFGSRSFTRRGHFLPGLSIHEMGGARMGKEPSSSVLDPYCRCWDAQNVIVSDAACFVSGAYQNPALTIMALSDRAAAYAVADYDDIAL